MRYAYWLSGHCSRVAVVSNAWRNASMSSSMLQKEARWIDALSSRRFLAFRLHCVYPCYVGL